VKSPFQRTYEPRKKKLERTLGKSNPYLKQTPTKFIHTHKKHQNLLTYLKKYFSTKILSKSSHVHSSKHNDKQYTTSQYYSFADAISVLFQNADNISVLFQKWRHTYPKVVPFNVPKMTSHLSPMPTSLPPPDVTLKKLMMSHLRCST
jgi:hypothetical protein